MVICLSRIHERFARLCGYAAKGSARGWAEGEEGTNHWDSLAPEVNGRH